VSISRSNACNPLAPRIDKNLGDPAVKRCRSVRLRIVGGYVFYPSTRHNHVALMLLSVQVMMSLVRRSLWTRRMVEKVMMEMMVMVHLRRLVYPLLLLLRLRYRMVYPLHRRRHIRIKWRLLLRGGCVQARGTSTSTG
jgi:hypothetical protein